MDERTRKDGPFCGPGRLARVAVTMADALTPSTMRPSKLEAASPSAFLATGDVAMPGQPFEPGSTELSICRAVSTSK